MFGYTAAEAIGQKMLLLLPLERQQEELDILARLWRRDSVSHFATTRLTKASLNSKT